MHMTIWWAVAIAIAFFVCFGVIAIILELAYQAAYEDEIVREMEDWERRFNQEVL